MSQDAKLTFKIKEYEESAKAFHIGIQTAQSLFQSFLFGNGALAALFGAAAGLLKDQVAISKYVLSIIPIAGILATVLFVTMISRYRRYLNIFRGRCVEIEVELGGKLFSLIEEYAPAGKASGPTVAISLIGIIFIAFWICLLIVVLVRL